MIKSSKPVAAIFGVSVLLLGLSACQKTEVTGQPGPAEKAGKQLDQATAQAGDTINKAATEVGKKVEQAGEKLQDTAKDGAKK